MSKKFAFFDGDNVGITIEKYLTKNNLESAQKISNGIKEAFRLIELELNKHSEVKILIIGGDDLLIEFADFNNTKYLLSLIIKIFKENTGLTISCGVGNSIKESIYSLHLSKLFGKNQVYQQ